MSPTLALPPSWRPFRPIRLTYDLALAGNLAYVADGSAGLRILNLADPLNPVELGRLVTPDPVEDVVIDGNLAYLGCGLEMRVVDITDPRLPITVGVMTTPGFCRALELAPDRLVIGDGYSLLVAPKQCPATSAVRLAEHHRKPRSVPEHAQPVQSADGNALPA